jgi:CheY-like chemotaxis protein
MAHALEWRGLADCVNDALGNARRKTYGISLLEGHVLLAEDNEDYRTIVSDALKVVGLRVSTFTNGRDLLDAIFSSAPPPFVVLTDLLMPLASGFDVIAELRGAGLLDTIPVVAMSALENRDPDVPCLLKPLDLATLLRTIEEKVKHAERSAEVARVRLQRVRQRKRAAR